MIPPGIDPHGLLVVVDLSWWIHKAFALGGVDGMVSTVVGWLVRLLEEPAPPMLAVALDSVGPTWRHRRTEGFAPERQYKANRERKPREFHLQARRILEIIGMHQIPAFWAEGWEADDSIAAAVEQAQRAGLTTAILTADKDLGQLVRSGPAGVYIWDGDASVRGPAEIEERWGVPPALLGDALAIIADKSDNLQGADGLGEKAAAAILRAHGSLAAAFAAETPDVRAQVKDFERRLAAAKRKKEPTETLAAELAAGRAVQHLAKATMRLQECRDAVELSRELIELDPQAPIAWDLDALPVGGFDGPRLSDVYANLGFTRLARVVRSTAKPRFEDILIEEPAA